jgi:hypothetical protein
MVRAGDTSSRQAVTTAISPAVKPPARQQKLTVRIPEYLAHALKQQALDQRTTVRHLVLLALQAAGHAIAAEDLLPGAGGSD